MNLFIKVILTSIFFACPFLEMHAQRQRSLEECIKYALENNIEIKQTALTSEIKEINLNMANNNRLPTLNSNLGYNNYFGRGPSRDGTYTDNSKLSSSTSVNASINVFSGFRINHDIKGKTFDLLASIKDLEYAKDNIALRITSLFLEVLLCKELICIAENQVKLSGEVVRRSEILVEAGKILKSQLYESKAILSRDELTLLQRKNNLNSALLNLCQAMNLESHHDFEITNNLVLDSPELSTGRRLNQIVEYAINARPNIRAEKLRLESSKYNLKVAKSSLYPQISLSGGYSNSYYYAFVTGYNNVDFLTQVKNNGNQFIGLSMSIPIFNRLSTRNQIRSSSIALQLQQLTLLNTENSVRKEIEQAYQNVYAAYRKYLASKESFEAVKEAFRYVEEYTKSGRATIYDYNDTKTRLEKSESEMIQAKYEFVFSQKILDMYSGISLTGKYIN